MVEISLNDNQCHTWKINTYCYTSFIFTCFYFIFILDWFFCNLRWYNWTGTIHIFLHGTSHLSQEFYNPMKTAKKLLLNSNLIMYKLRILYYSSVYNSVRSLSLSNIHLASEFFVFSDYLRTRCPILDETWETKGEKHTK